MFVTVDRTRRARRRPDLREDAARAPRALPRWPATTSSSTARASCRLRSGHASASSRATSAADVERALLDVFSNRTLPDGRRGFFHPDDFTFGQPVYLSPLYAAAQRSTASHSVDVTRSSGSGAPGRRSPRRTGRLDLGRLEIARLDNDPNFPEHGVLELTLKGGM